MNARQRAEAVLDAGTLTTAAPAGARTELFVGAGCIDGIPVSVAFFDGHVRGGTLGVREARELARVAEAAARRVPAGTRPSVLLLGFDTGGVRVEEGPQALAAASAAGTALARYSLQGGCLVGVISGPRGCFGAPAVMAALPEYVVMTAAAHWGLTGPRLFGGTESRAAMEAEGWQATSAATRLDNGDVHAVVADEPAAVRAALREHLARRGAEPQRARCLPELIEGRIEASAAVVAQLHRRLVEESEPLPPSVPPLEPRRQDLFRYSFRRLWKATSPTLRRGRVHAAFGTLGAHPAVAFLVGAEARRTGGVGIAEAAAVTEMLSLAARTSGERAAVLTFLFCQGHAVDLSQERFGLPRALAECLRAMVAARLLGHPIVSVLGGGTYGAAYLSLAAPSHRILALRGTLVAPMAPPVLQAFQALRGQETKSDPAAQLADLIPDIRIVDSVLRLPRVLRDEVNATLASVPADADAA